MQDKFSVGINNCVPGIAPTMKARYTVRFLGEEMAVNSFNSIFTIILHHGPGILPALRWLSGQT